MLDKKLTPIIAALGAVALMTSAPAFAQTADNAAAPAAATADAAATPVAANADAAAASAPAAPPTMEKQSHGGRMTPITMFMDAEWVVKVV
ncbi:MAG: flagellar motor protein MotA, partial [Ignavibacteriales bacterium]